MNIIAIDLGKFNSMICFYDTTTREHSFAKATTEKGYFRSLFENHDVDLVVVGPEAPLVGGLSDALRAIDIPSFGPHSAGAMLEGSKDFAKQVMLDLNIPTAGVQHLTDETDLDEAIDIWGSPWVVKRDVLAGGKGVVVTEDRTEALDFIQDGRIELNGELPLNTFGGSLGTGRIHGLWHIIEGALQASGRAGSRQVKNANVSFVGASAPIVTGTTFIFVGDPY